MFCIKCGALIEDDSKFCAECGTRVYDDSPVNEAPVSTPEKAEPVKEAIKEAPASEIYEKKNITVTGSSVREAAPRAEEKNDAEGINLDKTVGANYLRRQKSGGVKKETDAVRPEKVSFVKEEIKQPEKKRETAFDDNGRGFSFNAEAVEEEAPSGGLSGASFFDDDDEEEKKPEKKKGPDKKKGKAKTLIIAAAALVLIAAGLTAYLLLGGSSGSSYYNTYNMSGDMIGVARDADTVFYINDNGYIVKNETEDDERTVIVDDKSSDMVYMYGEKIYFRSTDDNYLYMCSSDGENIEKAVSPRVFWFTFIGDELYYIDGYYEYDENNEEKTTEGQFNLYKSKADGSDEKQIINDVVSRVFIGKDFIVYYNEETNSLYKTDIDGEDRKLLYECEDEAEIRDIKVHKDTVLFTYIDFSNKVLSGVYSIGLDGNNKKKIVNTEEGSITLKDGRLIYVSSSDSRTYMSDIDGSNEDDILDVPVYSPVISGSFMYFYNSEDEKLSVMEYDFKKDELRYLEDDLYGKTVFTNKYIFYISREDDNIYRCDHNGKDAVQLTDGECKALYLYNDEIYFVGYANGYTSDDSVTLTGIETFGLYKLDEEGESCTAVELGLNESIAFSGDYVYFTEGDENVIYRTDLSEIDTTLPDTPFITAESGITFGEICFAENGYICLEAEEDGNDKLIRINIDSGAVETIYDGLVSDVQYEDGRVYFISSEEDSNEETEENADEDNNENKDEEEKDEDTSEEKTLYCMNPDGSALSKVITAEITEYCVSDSIVYYIDSLTGNLCMVASNGSNNNTLCETSAANISVYDGYVYFTDRYESGHTYCVETSGGAKEAVIEDVDEATDKTSYKTHGVDGASPEIPTMPAA